jgi:hypothetical protein
MRSALSSVYILPATLVRLCDLLGADRLACEPKRLALQTLTRLNWEAVTD